MIPHPDHLKMLDYGIAFFYVLLANHYACGGTDIQILRHRRGRAPSRLMHDYGSPHHTFRHDGSLLVSLARMARAESQYPSDDITS